MCAYMKNWFSHDVRSLRWRICFEQSHDSTHQEAGWMTGHLWALDYRPTWNVSGRQLTFQEHLTVSLTSWWWQFILTSLLLDYFCKRLMNFISLQTAHFWLYGFSLLYIYFLSHPVCTLLFLFLYFVVLLTSRHGSFKSLSFSLSSFLIHELKASPASYKFDISWFILNATKRHLSFPQV